MMSNAERLYTLATRAYPPAYAAEHGDELIVTACELTGHRVSLREAAGLITGGIRTRARVATTRGRGASVWASGLRLGLLFFSISQLAWALSPPTEWGINFSLPIWAYIINIAMVAGLTIGTGRWYASFSTVTTIGIWAWSYAMNSPNPPWWMVLPAAAVISLVWWLALRTDGRRVISPIGGLALLVAWWAVFELAPGIRFVALIERTGNAAIMLAIALIGLAVLHLDPRLMAGVAAFFILDVATSLPTLISVMGVSSTPLLIASALTLTASWFAIRRGSRRLQHA